MYSKPFVYYCHQYTSFIEKQYYEHPSDYICSINNLKKTYRNIPKIGHQNWYYRILSFVEIAENIKTDKNTLLPLIVNLTIER